MLSEKCPISELRSIILFGSSGMTEVDLDHHHLELDSRIQEA